MESVTMDEITDFAMRNGHTLTDMPMRCGKRLGDLTKEDVLKEAALAKRLGRIYSKRADALTSVANAGYSGSLAGYLVGLNFKRSDDRAIADDRDFLRRLQEWAESPVV